MWGWLAENKDQISAISTLLTMAALVAGVVWGSWKLGVFRTLRPRLQLDVTASWLAKDGLLMVNMNLKNEGEVPIVLADNIRHQVRLLVADEGDLIGSRENGVGVVWTAVPDSHRFVDALDLKPLPLELKSGESISAATAFGVPSQGAVGLVEVNVVGQRGLSPSTDLLWSSTIVVAKEPG